MRRRGQRYAGALVLAVILAAGCARAHPGKPLTLAPASSLPSSASSHVVLLMMENAESRSVIASPAAPYVNSLIRRYGLAMESFAVTHPSLPNYLALTSGSTQGVSSDCTDCRVSARNIVDQLQLAGISWKAYMEDLPAPCFRGASAGGYAKKHDPFLYYTDVVSSLARCRRVVDFSALGADLRRGRLPTFAWISPNLCDDGHDCGVAGADRFLAHAVPALTRELGPQGFLVITWDEGSSDAGCCGGVAHGGHIATVLIGPEVRPGARESGPLDHYGVLGTIEQALGLPPLGAAADQRSGRLTTMFLRAPHLG